MDDEELYNRYLNLSPKCKEIFIYCLFSGCDMMKFAKETGLDYSLCNSPIEKYFKYGYDLLNFLHPEKFKGIELVAQEEIVVGNKIYYADFVMKQTNKFERDFKLVIECDGHEYHSTKEQIRKDNLRDLDLKTAGYDVLHFSGSQLYNEIMVCVIDAYDYFMKMSGKLKRRARNGKCKE